MNDGNTFGLSLIDKLFDFDFVKTKRQILPYEFAKARRILPLEEKDGELLVAISDPLALEA